MLMGLVSLKLLGGCHEICVAETSNIALSKILSKWEMDRFVRLPGSLKGTVARTTGASTTEAIVAAVWIDSNRDFDTVQRVIHNLHIGVEAQSSNRLPEKAKAGMVVIT